MKTLVLTSPHMKGADVKAAQQLLAQHGYLAKKDVDSEYGPVTATAAKQAKWDLGYKATECKATFGARLAAYLSGKAEPTSAMRVRAKIREQQKKQPVGARAADRMVSWWMPGRWVEVPAGSNVVPQLQRVSRDLGLAEYLVRMGQPWCAQSAMTAALCEGSKTAAYGLRQGRFNALYCPTLRDIASTGSYGARAVSKNTLKKGTMVLFCWDGSGTPEHIGIALGKVGEKVTASGKTFDPGKKGIVTVEGNSSDAVRVNVHADLSKVCFTFEIT